MKHQHSKPTDHTSHPHKKDGESSLRLVAWETTRNCNLACIHCRASATTGPHSGELDTSEAFQLMDQIAEIAKPIIKKGNILKYGITIVWLRRLVS